jgi:hypothetical protein
MELVEAGAGVQNTGAKRSWMHEGKLVVLASYT